MPTNCWLRVFMYYYERVINKNRKTYTVLHWPTSEHAPSINLRSFHYLMVTTPQTCRLSETW
jgi:hypothetical protein